MTRRIIGQALMGIIIAVMIIVPFFVQDEQWVNLVSLILIWALFAIGFDLVFGVTGMLSFGHAALFGAGGYALTILTLSYGVGFIPGLFAAAIVGAVLAYLMGLFALRVSGLFFALLTLALAIRNRWPGTVPSLRLLMRVAFLRSV